MNKNWILLLLALCLSTGCWKSSPKLGPKTEHKEPRLVMLYVSCSVNRDYLSPYSENSNFTPALQSLADDGVVFRRHTTPSGHSGPTFASIFTGLDVEGHLVFRHPAVLPENLYLITEAFADRGYDAHYWGGHGMASGHLNYDQGAEESQSHILEPLTADDEEFQKIIERLKSDPDYKALVVSVGSRTHFPYVGGLYEEFVEQFPEHKVDLPAKRFQELHKEYYQNHLAYSLAFDQTAAERGLSEKDKEQLTQVVDAVYKASVYELDKDVGRLLTAIDDAGLKDDSLIAFTVDHGEVMTTETAPHRWTHGYMVTPEMMNVPLLIRGPAVKAKVVESVSRAVDVFPTLMALSGRALSAEHKIDGQDFSAAAAGTGEAPKVKAPFHTSLMLTSYYDTHHKMLALSDYLKAHFSSEGPETIWTGSRDMDTLYVYRPDGKEWGLQVFDLATDPIMKKNLYDESNPEHKTALEELAARKQNIVKTFEEKQDIIKEMRIPEEVEKEKLKSLNYI